VFIQNQRIGFNDYWAVRAESLNVIHVNCSMLRINKSMGNKQERNIL
jgi:hypothetical protein